LILKVLYNLVQNYKEVQIYYSYTNQTSPSLPSASVGSVLDTVIFLTPAIPRLVNTYVFSAAVNDCAVFLKACEERVASISVTLLSTVVYVA